MNRIYKVVWNKVRNCYVVVSELAKSTGKSSQDKRVRPLSMKAAAVLAAFFVTVGGGTLTAVQAADTTSTVALQAEQQQDSKDINKSVNQDGTVEVDTTNYGGPKVTVTDVQKKSVLEHAGIKAGSVGKNTGRIVSLGEAKIGDNSREVVSLGYASVGNNVYKGIAINGNISTWGTNNQIALGGQTTQNGAVALGYGTEASTANSVALGNGSKAYANDINNAKEKKVVSIGNSKKNSHRRLINLAEGENDYDAVNVKQLKEVKATADNSVQYDKLESGKINTGSVTFQGVTQKIKGQDGKDVEVNTGTTLNQVKDISVQTPVYEMGQWGYTDKVIGYESRSFANAGIVPGKLDGDRANKGNNVAIDDYSHIINAEQSIAIGSATVDMTNVKQTGAEGVGPWNGIAIGQIASVKDSHNGVAIGSLCRINR